MKKLTFKDFQIFNYHLKFLDGTVFGIRIIAKSKESADKSACGKAAMYSREFKMVVFPVFVSQQPCKEPLLYNPEISVPSLEDRIKKSLHPKINFDNSI